MVITTRMIHQMSLEPKNKKDHKMSTEVSEMKILESFLKNSEDLDKSQKKVIS